MRRILLTLLIVGIAAPLAAQKPPKHDRFKITAQELAEYAEQPLDEVIRKARPHFLIFNAGTSQGMGEATMVGEPPRLLVYVGSRMEGDTSMLKMYKAAEVREVRYYRPNEASSRLGANNASVIQLTLAARSERP